MNWTKYKFEWLHVLLMDVPTRGIAHDLGALFATRYLNPESEDAWPGIDTLADDLAISRRGCIKALNKLIDGGWLKRERGGGGRSSRYRLPNRIPMPRRSDREDDIDTSEARFTGAPQRTNQCTVEHQPVHPGSPHQCTPVHPNREVKGKRREEEGVQPALRRDSPSIPRVVSTRAAATRQPREAKHQQSDRSEAQQPRNHTVTSTRPKVSTFPDDWTLGNDEIAAAHRLVDWDLPKTEQEFATFKDWHASRGTQSSNWPASWRTWCRRGQEHAAKEDTRPLTGFQNKLVGINTWLQDQKTTKH